MPREYIKCHLRMSIQRHSVGYPATPVQNQIIPSDLASYLVMVFFMCFTGLFFPLFYRVFFMCFAGFSFLHQGHE